MFQIWLCLYLVWGAVALGSGLATLVWIAPTLPHTWWGNLPGAAAIAAIIYGLSLWGEVWDTLPGGLKPALPPQDKVEDNPG